LEAFDLARTLKFLPGIVIGLTVHEFCHAWVAQLCGDTTAREEGRVTLNPLKHIDPMGFILLLAVGFGWAKPVQFNEQNLRNPRTDIMKIAIAGPLSNALIAMILSVVFVIMIKFIPMYSGRTSDIVYEVLDYAISINWSLFVFNLIPLPPLDGSHLLLNQFRKHPSVYHALYKYGSFVLFGLIIGSLVTKIDLLPIWPVIKFFAQGFLHLIQF
jgi:Zn-dependent protease